MDLTDLILKIYEAQAVKFGSFKLKSGILSPIYVDLRVIVSYPKLLKSVADAIWTRVQTMDFDCICGVPYTALPIATAISLAHDKPMVVRRKEVKNYGTAKAIEGHFKSGQRCLIVEDLVTSGISIFETVEPLKHEGLEVSDIVVLLDREQGGRAHIESRGYHLHAVITITQLLTVLQEAGKLDPDTVKRTLAFVAENQTANPIAAPSSAVMPAPAPPKPLAFEDRAALCTNPAARKLLQIMAAKKTNLCVAGDVSSKGRLLELADVVGPYICCLKTHADTITDWDAECGPALRRLAASHQFLIFEDRKFADIGNTCAMQYGGGIHRIAEWADIVNAHVVPGPGVIQGLAEVGLVKGQGLLLLAQMSSAGTLAKGEYTRAAVEMAKAHEEFVIGFISQEQLTPEVPTMIHMTPGVQLAKGGDALGQQYDTPEQVVATRFSDIIIVGRGIYAAPDPLAEALRYRDAGWVAYQRRLA